jgi:hypothetical protein
MHFRHRHEDLSPLEYLARRRAKAKLGWYAHALVYITVNAALGLAAASTGHHWAVFPALGWGLGLLIHGGVVFLATGGGLLERLIQRERERLARQQA